jgi:segment polarity protein dishevelled
LVHWLFEHVDGFVNRNDARKYASSMLKAGYIRHIVHKLTFSEQCYYIFGDLYTQGMIYLKQEFIFFNNIKQRNTSL